MSTRAEGLSEEEETVFMEERLMKEWQAIAYSIALYNGRQECSDV